MKHALIVMALVAIITGCQTVDPASRSNRTSYRDLYVQIEGTSNTVEMTVGDGLYASADGGGDSQENTATQTTDTKPEVAVGVGGGSAGTGGATPSSGIVGAALEKVMSILSGKAPADTKLTKEEADAITGCVGGLCADTTTTQ